MNQLTKTGPQLQPGKQKALFNIGAVVFAIVLLALAAPIIAFALGAVINIGIIVAFGVGIAGLWTAKPALTLWWKNRVLKMLKAEARSNPIETLQNELLRRRDRVVLADQKVRELDEQRMTLKDMLDDYKEKFGEDDPKLLELYEKLSRLVDSLQVKLRHADQQVKAFAGHVEQQAAKYKIAVKTGALAAALRQATGDEDPYRQFVHDEAMDSVRVQYNQSMADINSLLADDPVVLQINQDESMRTIDLSPIEYADLEPELITR